MWPCTALRWRCAASPIGSASPTCLLVGQRRRACGIGEIVRGRAPRCAKATESAALALARTAPRRRPRAGGHTDSWRARRARVAHMRGYARCTDRSSRARTAARARERRTAARASARTPSRAWATSARRPHAHVRARACVLAAHARACARAAVAARPRPLPRAGARTSAREHARARHRDACSGRALLAPRGPLTRSVRRAPRRRLREASARAADVRGGELSVLEMARWARRGRGDAAGECLTLGRGLPTSPRAAERLPGRASTRVTSRDSGEAAGVRGKGGGGRGVRGRPATEGLLDESEITPIFLWRTTQPFPPTEGGVGRSP